MENHSPMTYREAWDLAQELRNKHCVVEMYRHSDSKCYVVMITGKIEENNSKEIDKF